MRARIYQPSKTAMSSGTAKTNHWILEFAPESPREIDPLMGWTSSSDTQSQVRLKFDTLDAAKAYAKEHGIEVVQLTPNKRKPNIRARGYAENFAVDRKGAWTH
jgi:NADH dehydrogenase